MLHPDYLTILQQEHHRRSFPTWATTLDLDEELRIHERMFSGDA